jgi:hypothetical protein
LLAFGFGAGGGLWGVNSNLAYIRFFGPLHLGEISGLSTSLTVFASAVGPAAFSLGLDYFGSYDAAVKICLVLLSALLCAATPVEAGRVAHRSVCLSLVVLMLYPKMRADRGLIERFNTVTESFECTGVFFINRFFQCFSGMSYVDWPLVHCQDAISVTRMVK